MRGVLRFILVIVGIAGCRRRIGGFADTRKLCLRIFLGGKTLDRHILRKGRVAQESGAVGIRQLHRFRDEMDGFRRVMTHRRDILVFHDIEDFADDDAAGRRKRHAVELVSAIFDHHRVFNHEHVGHRLFQIFHAHHAAGGLDGVDDLLSHFALVEPFDSVFRDVIQRIDIILIVDDVALFIREDAILEPNAAGILAERQLFIRVFDHALHGRRHANAVFARLGDVRDDFRERHGSEIVQRHLIGRQRLHDRGRFAGVVERGTLFLVDRSIRIIQLLEVIFRHVHRCRELAGNRNVFLLIRQPDVHESAAAETVGVRLKKSDCQTGRHSRVYRIAAGLEHFDTYLGCFSLARNHSAVFAPRISFGRSFGSNALVAAVGRDRTCFRVRLSQCRCSAHQHRKRQGESQKAFHRFHRFPSFVV